MKRNWRNSSSAILVLLLALLVQGCGGGHDHAQDADTYICPMHPTVVSDRPSTCPVCGMDLVRKARPGEEVKITEDLSRLITSPNEFVVSDIKTVRGQYRSMGYEVHAQGIVTYDQRNLGIIPARISGRLEKVYIRYPFQKVTAGQRIAEIYSPELLTAQRELLFLLDSDPDNAQLIAGAMSKLSLLGATSSQIHDLRSTKKIQSTVTLYSPLSGYVISLDQQAPDAPVSSRTFTASGGMSDGMSGGSPAPMPPAPQASGAGTGTVIREGTYVTAGQSLFKVVNSRDLLVELKLPLNQASNVKKGDELMLTLPSGKTLAGETGLVEPFLQEGEDFVTIRVYMSATETVPVGSLVMASLKAQTSESLWVPREAVLDLGIDKIVFVSNRNVLRPKKVVVGKTVDSMTEIVRGLSSTEEIAANAQFLVDSESLIKMEP
jgi:membrane fusion protein, copper/silver efflux system